MAAAALMAAPLAMAEDVVVMPERIAVDVEAAQQVELAHGVDVVADSTGSAASRISGVVGVDLYSHFVSYGLDVWGEGEAFSGSETLNPYAEIAVEFDTFNLAVGLWGDVNDNTAASIGGELQEVDFYVGASKDVDKFSLGVTYQAWMYAGNTEKILDVSIGYDDSELWGNEGFTLSPSLTIHNRIGGDGLEKGTVVVLGGEYGVSLDEDCPVDLAVPFSLGYSLNDDYFRAGGDSGLAFLSVGVTASYGLGDIISAEYGEWSLNAGLTLYITEEDVYQNPEDTFLVANVGISMAF